RTPDMRRLLVILAIVALVVFGALASGTQYCASSFRYHPALGEPLVTVWGSPIYAPWAWLGWARRFGDRAPRTFAVAEALAFGGGAVAFMIVLVVLAPLRRARESTAHGSARWATRRELADAGLLDDAGIVLCQTAEARLTSRSDGRGGRSWKLARSGTLIRHAGPEHVLVFAPTRSGKGVGTVVPTLLTWPSSVVVYDIKKELWELTAGR